MSEQCQQDRQKGQIETLFSVIKQKLLKWFLFCYMPKDNVLLSVKDLFKPLVLQAVHTQFNVFSFSLPKFKALLITKTRTTSLLQYNSFSNNYELIHQKQFGLI